MRFQWYKYRQSQPYLNMHLILPPGVEKLLITEVDCSNQHAFDILYGLYRVESDGPDGETPLPMRKNDQCKVFEFVNKIKKYTGIFRSDFTCAALGIWAEPARMEVCRVTRHSVFIFGIPHNQRLSTGFVEDLNRDIFQFYRSRAMPVERQITQLPQLRA